MPGAAVAAGLVGRRVSNLESLVEGAGWRAWTEWEVHVESSSVVSADIGWGGGDAGPVWKWRGHSGMPGPS